MLPVLPDEHVSALHAFERERAPRLGLAHDCKDLIEGLEEHRFAAAWLANDRKVRPAARAQLKGAANVVCKSGRTL